MTGGNGTGKDIGKARPAMFLTLSRQVLFILPMVLILPPIFGLKGVWMAFPAADVIAFIATLTMVMHTLRRLAPAEAAVATSP